jgi:hypothetical protein
LFGRPKPSVGCSVNGIIIIIIRRRRRRKRRRRRRHSNVYRLDFRPEIQLQNTLRSCILVIRPDKK